MRKIEKGKVGKENIFYSLFKIWWFFVQRQETLYAMSSWKELLVRGAYYGGLMGYFGIDKTLETLKEQLYWPKM